MSDVSDPEDEIVDIGPDPPKVAPASVPQHVQHGGCQARRPLNQKPPGADKWSSIYTVYLNKNRTKAQVNKKKLKKKTINFCRVVECQKKLPLSIQLFMKSKIFYITWASKSTQKIR